MASQNWGTSENSPNKIPIDKNLIKRIDEIQEDVNEVNNGFADINSEFRHFNSVLRDLSNDVNETNRLFNTLDSRGNSCDLTKLCDSLDSVNDKFESIEDFVSDVNKTIANAGDKVSDLRFYLSEMTDCLIFKEIVFYNISEKNKLTTGENFLRFCENELSLDKARENVMLGQVYRVGLKESGVNRPLVVEFQHETDRNLVLAAAKKLDIAPFSVSTNFPEKIKRRRANLMPQFMEERARGKLCNLVWDELVIDGVPQSRWRVDREEQKLGFMSLNIGRKNMGAKRLRRQFHTCWKSDVIFLSETGWGRPTCEALKELSGYKFFNVPCEIIGKTNSYGVSVLYKKCLEGKLQLNAVTERQIITVCFPKENFDLERDTICIFLYIPSDRSKYYSKNSLDRMGYFTTLREVVSEYAEGNIFIAGDLNSRTGREPDIASWKTQPLKFRKRFARMSQDWIRNAFGKELLGLCRATGLRIVNGRLHKDAEVGKFTWEMPPHQSVIDYLLAPKSAFQDIVSFEVGDQDISDHSPLFFRLNITIPDEEEETYDEKGEESGEDNSFDDGDSGSDDAF